MRLTQSHARHNEGHQTGPDYNCIVPSAPAVPERRTLDVRLPTCTVSHTLHARTHARLIHVLLCCQWLKRGAAPKTTVKRNKDAAATATERTHTHVRSRASTRRVKPVAHGGSHVEGRTCVCERVPCAAAAAASQEWTRTTSERHRTIVIASFDTDALKL